MVIDDHVMNRIGILDSLFPYNSFYIPLFVFISGYFYREESIGKNIVHKVKRLLIPYLIWSLVGELIALVLMKAGIVNWYVSPFSFKKIMYLLLYGPLSSITGAAWFVIMLFWVSILYNALHLLLKLENSTIMQYVFLAISVISGFAAIKLCMMGYHQKIYLTFDTGNGVKTLREGIDYTVKYSNNKAVTGTKRPTLIITGKGNYTGKINRAFDISKSDISSLAISVDNVSANSRKKGKYYCSKPTIIDANGLALKENTDFTVTYVYESKGRFIFIQNDDVLPEGAKVRASITATEKNYTGSTYVIYEITPEARSLSKVKVRKIKSQPYTGKPIEVKGLDIRYVIGSGNNKAEISLKENEDYVITGYYNNVKKGTASLRIEGRGRYSGYKIIKFKIVSADTASIWDGSYFDGKLHR